MSIPLEEEFSKQRGSYFVDMIEHDITDNWPRYSKVREYRSLYYGTATASMPLPWKGASNIHLPVMMEKVETFVPLVMSAFWGIEPHVNVLRSPDEFNSGQTYDIETFLNFVVEKDIPDFYETFESWIRNTGIESLATLSPSWERKHRDVSMIHTLKKLYDIEEQTAAGTPAPEAREKSGLELLVDIFGRIEAPTGLIDARPVVGEEDGPVVGSEWIAYFLEDRIEYSAYVRFLPGIRVDEVRAQVRRTILERDGARVDLLEFEDLVLPYRTANIQEADRVTQRYWLTVEEVEERQQSGEWNITDEDLEILRAQGTRKQEQVHLDAQLQDQKDSVIGETRGYGVERKAALPVGFEAYNKNKIQVFRVFTRDAVERGGPRCEVIYHIPYGLRRIVQAQYLDEEYPHGRRPFITAKYLPISGRWGALGLGDQLAAINLEVNALVNYINNNQELINNPFFFYEPTALTSDQQSLEGIKPGQGIPVMSVQGIMFPKFGQEPLANMSVMTSLLMFADRLTISPMNAGSSQMKNAPQTARGTLALLGEGHVKTDMLITRLQKGPWTELIEQLYGLYQEFMPDEKWYYVTRTDGKLRPNRITKTMMRGRYEFLFKGNTTNTNKEVLASKSQLVYNTVMTHPDYSTDAHVRRAAILYFLKYNCEGDDIDKFVPALPSEGAYMHPPMSQRDENKVIEMSVPVMVLPSDAHAEHLQVMDQFEQSQQFATMPEHAVALWASHKLQHQQMLRQQASQQNLPVQPGQGNNVPQGMSQAGGGNDTGVMEGGVQ
jgi:hypothetical protein